MAWIDLLAASWALLTQGKIFEAVLLSYTNVMGVWFYGIMMFMAMAMIYLKTNNFGTVIVTGLVISGAAMPFMPEGSLLFITVMVSLGITFILYKAFHK